MFVPNLRTFCYNCQMSRRGKRKKIGLTLIEIIVSLGLLALGTVVLLQGFVNLRGSRAHVKAEAEQVAELMRTLRQQAVTENRPLGLGFPTQGGSRACSNGYYLLEGEHHPKVVRRVVMKRDRAIQVSGCFWPELAFSPPTTSTFSNSSYQLSTWQAPYPQDGLLMFLPSGEVLTNLPTFQGEAAVVLGFAIEGRVSSVGSAPAMQLERVKGPMVVWCSLVGEVRLDGGLGSAPGRVSDSVAAADPADVPALTGNSNSNPVFVNAPTMTTPLQISPPPNPNTLPVVAGGSTGTLRAKRYLSLKVTARDPDGDALYCTWDAGNSGTFTKSEDVRMVYDPKLGLWVATWAWHPPENATAPASFTLHATINDRRGGSATLAGLISGGGNFRILTPGRLAFDRGGDVWMSNWDGTDPVIVAKGAGKPRWSRDGRNIVCSEPGGNLIVVPPDGRRRSTVFNAGGNYASPGSFNTDSDRIVFVTQTAGGSVVGEVEPWGGAQSQSPWNVPMTELNLTNFPVGSRPVVECSPLDKHIAIVSRSDGTNGPLVVLDTNTDPGTATVLPGPLGSEASLTSAGDIVYRSGPGQFSRVPLAGGTPTLTSSLADGHFPRYPGQNTNYAVATGNDGTQENCFLFMDGATLGSPRKLFDFAEPCRDPDWAD